MQKVGMQISSATVLRQQGKGFYQPASKITQAQISWNSAAEGMHFSVQPSAILVSPDSLEATDLHLPPAG